MAVFSSFPALLIFKPCYNPPIFTKPSPSTLILIMIIISPPSRNCPQVQNAQNGCLTIG